jgi:transcriptional regulator
MYIPAAFAEDQVSVLHDAIRTFGFATLVSQTANGLMASHLPLMVEPEPAPFGTLIGHFARANPHAADATGETLAIFLGPQGYITPQYYATKRQTAKVVPTWNYAAIHAYGTMRFIDDRDGKLAIVTRLTEHHEGKLAVPWQVSDAPADFIDTMLNSIIGFEMTITRLEGKWKMSQNRPETDRVGVIEGLRADGQPELSDTVARVAGPAARTA